MREEQQIEDAINYVFSHYKSLSYEEREEFHLMNEMGERMLRNWHDDNHAFGKGTMNVFIEMFYGLKESIDGRGDKRRRVLSIPKKSST